MTSSGYNSEFEQTFSSKTFSLPNYFHNFFVEKKLYQPLVAAYNASEQLDIDNFVKTSSGTLSPLMSTVVLDMKIPQPLVAADNASKKLDTDNFVKTSSGTLLPLMSTDVLDMKNPQPLVVAHNASEQLDTDNFVKTNSGTLSLPILTVVFGKEESSAARGR